MRASVERDPRSKRIGPWLACALVMPVLVCGSGPLRSALRPDATGTAWIALALLPGVLCAAWARSRPPTEAALLLAAVAWVLLGTSLQEPTDGFEAGRALLLLTVAVAAYLSGTALDARGRSWFLAGLGVAAVPVWAFGLGNTGSTSEALLPAALAAAVLAARARRPTGPAALALSIPLLFALYAGSAPVIAGAVSFAAALALAAVLAPARSGPRHPRRALALTLAAGILAFSGAWAGRQAFPPPSVTPGAAPDAAESARPPGATAPEEVSSGGPAQVTGGFAVRARIWPRVVAMTLDHALLGVGAGQFAVAFPPWRDPEEIELSSFGRELWQETEVEHAHSDPLQLMAEGGLPAALLGGLFLAAVLRRAVRALAGADASKAALGAALVGLAAGGLFRVPVSVDPVSSYVAFALAGALGGTASRARSRALPLLAALLLLVGAPSALRFVRHDAALARAFERARAPGSDPSDPLGRRALSEALAARPDSALALTHLARLDELAGAPPEDLARRWQAVLELRPHRVEALVQHGYHSLAAGHPDVARSDWEHALELDPLRPGTRRNLARLAAEEGRSADLEALEVPGEERAELGIAAALAGHPELARELLAPSDERWRDLAPDPAFAYYQRERDAGHEPLAWAFKAYAHQLWGRQQAERGEFDLAVRSYRQAAQAGARGRGRPAPALELELGAALVRAGRRSEAAGELAAAGARAVDLVTLPDWAGQALLEAGLLPR